MHTYPVTVFPLMMGLLRTERNKWVNFYRKGVLAFSESWDFWVVPMTKLLHKYQIQKWKQRNGAMSGRMNTGVQTMMWYVFNRSLFWFLFKHYIIWICYICHSKLRVKCMHHAYKKCHRTSLCNWISSHHNFILENTWKVEESKQKARIPQTLKVENNKYTFDTTRF